MKKNLRTQKKEKFTIQYSFINDPEKGKHTVTQRCVISVYRNIIHNSCGSSLCHWEREPEEINLKKGLFWLLVSEAVVWFLCLQACCEAKNSSHSGWEKCSLNCHQETGRHDRPFITSPSETLQINHWMNPLMLQSSSSGSI